MPESGHVIAVPLNGLIREVIKRNAALMSEKIQLKVSGHRADYEKQIFIPEFSTSVAYHDTDTPNNTSETLSRGGLETHEEREWSFKAGFGGLLPTGAEWDLSYLQSRTSSSLIDSLRTYENEYESQVKFTLSQPLLKGFGSDMVLSEYAKARLDQKMQKQTYENLTMNLVAHTIQEYWKLHGAQDLIRSLTKSVKMLRESEVLLKQKLEAGEVAEDELLEARSSRISREVELEAMRNNRDKSKYTVMSLLNLDLARRNEYVFKTSSQDDAGESDVLDFENAFEQMRASWPQFKLAQAKVERAEIEYRQKRDAARPDLALVLSGWLSNLDDETIASDSVEDEFPSWKVGVEFSMPISSARQKSAVSIAAWNLHQAQLELEYLERSARIDLKIMQQSMQGAAQQLGIMQAAYRLKEQLLEGQFKRFQFGEVSIRDVIQKEDEVSLYQRKIVNQFIASKISQVNFDKFRGVILTKYCPDYDQFFENLDSPYVSPNLESGSFL
jgi:outer membrane protein TolC